MVRVRMGDASMGELHIVLGDDAQNFFDVPCGIHHRYLASLEGANQVEANFLKDKKIILGCQAGPRSNRAAELLQGTGYQDVSSVRGGFGGMRDPSGQVIAPGWSSLGLPVSQENEDGVSYESLAAKAN